MSLSDLFAEREQYDWMLDTLFEVYKSHPGEDEIAMQYLNVAICKAAAVVGVVSRSDTLEYKLFMLNSTGPEISTAHNQ